MKADKATKIEADTYVVGQLRTMEREEMNDPKEVILHLVSARHTCMTGLLYLVLFFCKVRLNGFKLFLTVPKILFRTTKQA